MDDRNRYRGIFAADGDELDLNAITVRLYNDHVPLYFWLFRIVSFVFFKGSGSIWIGLSINLFFYLFLLETLYFVFLRLVKSPVLSGIVVLLSFIVNRLVIEQATTLRMYMMLLWAQVLLLLAGMWVIESVWKNKLSPLSFIGLYLISVIGFLTHYDFWVFYAMTAAFCCMWLLIMAVKKRGKIRKFGICVTSVILSAAIFAGELIIIDGGRGITYLFQEKKDVNVLKAHEDIPWIVYGPTLGVYSYYDWLIPQKICFLTTEDTLEDRQTIQELQGENRFILYLHEGYFPQALELFEQELDRKFEGRYLFNSYNLSVYLIESGL